MCLNGRSIVCLVFPYNEIYNSRPKESIERPFCLKYAFKFLLNAY